MLPVGPALEGGEVKGTLQGAPKRVWRDEVGNGWAR